MFHKFHTEKYLETKSIGEAQDALNGTFQYLDPHATTLEKVEVNVDGEVKVDGLGCQPMTQYAFETLNKVSDIPQRYAESIDAQLWVNNINTNAEYNKKPIWVRTSTSRDDKPYITAFLPSEKNQARNTDLLGLFAEDENYAVNKIQIWDSGFKTGITDKTFDGVEPAVGDISKLGYTAINSEIGQLSAKVEAMTFRLVCSNGAMFGESLGRAYWPSDRRLSYVASFAALEKQFEEISVNVEQLKDAYERSVDTALTMKDLTLLWRRVERVLRSREAADFILHLGADERKKMIREERDRQKDEQKTGMVTPSPVTSVVLYDAFNRITEYARESQEFTVSHHLEQIAGSAMIEITRQAA